jgi:nickel/cobalt transporter (NicO) family protein
MMSSLFVTLMLAAATVGALHALAPDHWLPIAVVSRSRSWSLARTGRVAMLCGVGHVTVSALLALIALYTGAGVVAAFGAQIASVAAILMIGFGITYALWGARHVIMRKLHGHDHAHLDHVHDPSQTSTWALFAIYSADACVAVIPIVFASATLPFAATLAIVLVYELSAITTMVTLAIASRAGAGALLRGRWIEHYGDSAAGALIAVTGIAVAVLGI